MHVFDAVYVCMYVCVLFHLIYFTDMNIRRKEESALIMHLQK